MQWQAHFSKILWLVAVVLVIGSCKKNSDSEGVDFKYGYFPLAVGTFQIYNVDSVVWNLILADTVDSTWYQRMEVVESHFVDSEGRPSARIEGFRRDSVHHPWSLVDVWTATLTNTTVEKVEDNLRFIKLVFPPKEEKTWRGNAFIHTPDYDWLGDWEYEMLWVDEPYLSDGSIYPTTIKVLQHLENTNLLTYQEAYEVYGQGIGMIEKEMTILNRDGFGQPVTDGFSVVMKLDTAGVN